MTSLLGSRLDATTRNSRSQVARAFARAAKARVALEGLVPLLAACEPSQSVAPFVDSFLVRGRTQLPLSAARSS